MPLTPLDPKGVDHATREARRRRTRWTRHCLQRCRSRERPHWRSPLALWLLRTSWDRADAGRRGLWRTAGSPPARPPRRSCPGRPHPGPATLGPASPRPTPELVPTPEPLRRPAESRGDHGGRGTVGVAEDAEHLDRVGRGPGLGVAHRPPSPTSRPRPPAPLRVRGRRTAQHRLRRRSLVPTTALVLGRRRAYNDRPGDRVGGSAPCAEPVHSQERSS